MNLLLDLGYSADEVAKTLVRLNCQGRRRSHDQCPLAVYFKTKGFPEISVCPGWVQFDDTCVGLPTPVGLFLSKFDTGQYPDLISDPADLVLKPSTGEDE